VISYLDNFLIIFYYWWKHSSWVFFFSCPSFLVSSFSWSRSRPTPHI